jgi:hypothetical protein
VVCELVVVFGDGVVDLVLLVNVTGVVVVMTLKFPVVVDGVRMGVVDGTSTHGGGEIGGGDLHLHSHSHSGGGQ